MKSQESSNSRWFQFSWVIGLCMAGLMKSGPATAQAQDADSCPRSITVTSNNYDNKKYELQIRRDILKIYTNSPASYEVCLDVVHHLPGLNKKLCDAYKEVVFGAFSLHIDVSSAPGTICEKRREISKVATVENVEFTYTSNDPKIERVLYFQEQIYQKKFPQYDFDGGAAVAKFIYISQSAVARPDLQAFLSRTLVKMKDEVHKIPGYVAFEVKPHCLSDEASPSLIEIIQRLREKQIEVIVLTDFGYKRRDGKVDRGF